MYGNNDNVCPSQYRVFPFVLAKICPLFSFASCCFSVEKTKQATARVTVWKELDIVNVFTLEASFFGSTGEPSHEYDVADYRNVGKKLCLAILACYRLNVLSFTLTHSGHLGATILEKPQFNASDSVGGYLLKDLHEALQKQLPFDLADPQSLLEIEPLEESFAVNKGFMTPLDDSAADAKKDVTVATAPSVNCSAVLGAHDSKPSHPRPPAQIGPPPKRSAFEVLRGPTRNHPA
jgi:hypothetical protein